MKGVSWERYVDYLEDLKIFDEKETFKDTKDTFLLKQTL